MKREAILDYYICNGKHYGTKDMGIFDNISGQSIYEVIRIIDGVPLFLEDHLERMRKSAEYLGMKIYKSDDEITSEILRLVQLNQCNNINVKLLYSSLENMEQIFLTYFIESHYPEDKVYKKGIKTILFHSERDHPNAKVANVNLRERVNKAMKDVDAYEALLVNKEGYITEGSRSNIFFVKGDTVYTAPGQDVLLGVTRTRIIKVCRELNINVMEKGIHMKDLEYFHGAFMSGTSVNVLPIEKIDENIMNSTENAIIHRIAEGYKMDVEKYFKIRNAR